MILAVQSAVILAALRDTAKEKQIDWSQIKAIVKAVILDERDETGSGTHMKRLSGKASAASEYLELLRLNPDRGEKNNISDAPSLRAGPAGHTPMRAGRDDNAALKEETNIQPVTAASSQADSNGEAVAPEPADKNAAASTNSPTGSSCPPAGGAVHDKAPQPPCTASSNLQDVIDIPIELRRRSDGGFVLQ